MHKHKFKPIQDGSNEMYQVYECKCLMRTFRLKDKYRKKK